MSTEYYPNGQKMRECNYENDKLSGTFREYDKDGNITQDAIYLLGFLAEKKDNPQHEREMQNLIFVGVATVSLLVGLLFGALSAKIKRSR